GRRSTCGLRGFSLSPGPHRRGPAPDRASCPRRAHLRAGQHGMGTSAAASGKTGGGGGVSRKGGCTRTRQLERAPAARPCLSPARENQRRREGSAFGAGRLGREKVAFH